MHHRKLMTARQKKQARERTRRLFITAHVSHAIADVLEPKNVTHYETNGGLCQIRMVVERDGIEEAYNLTLTKVRT